MKKYEITTGVDFFYFDDKVCIFTDVELKERIDPEALKRATELVFKRFPYFAVKKVVSEDGGRYILESNSTPVVVIEKNGYVPIDCEESGYHLAAVSYWQNHIFFSMLHGLTDGGGAKTVAKTLVRAYFECLDNRVYPGDPQTDVNRLPDEDEYRDPYDYLREIDHCFRLKRSEPFYFSPDDVYDNEAYLYRFFTPENTIVSFSKQFESGVSGLIALAMARAIDIIRRDDEKPICISCPMDLRRILGIPNSMRNCTKSTKYEHTAKLRSMSTDRQMTAIKGQMLIQSCEEFQLPRFKEDRDDLVRCYSRNSVNKVFNYFAMWDKTMTPIVSYLGVIDFGELNERISDINIYSKVIGRSGMQAVCLCFDGRCNVTVSSNLKDERYVRVFANEMEDFSGKRTPIIKTDYNSPAINREDSIIG